MSRQVKSLNSKPAGKLFGFLLLAVIALTVALSTSAYAADITVNDELGLRAAVAGAPAMPYEIELTADITLLGSALDIPAGKNVTLTGGYSLIGADEEDAINVSGTLTLDGITVTHLVGDIGRGVYVQSGGALTLSSGTISGNTAFVYIGGVYNAGTLTLKDGEVSGNAAHHGGNVHNTGTFTMEGGKISDSTTDNGGGGGVSNTGTFTLKDGEVSGNTTTNAGGGVHNTGTFTMEGGPSLTTRPQAAAACPTPAPSLWRVAPSPIMRLPSRAAACGMTTAPSP